MEKKTETATLAGGCFWCLEAIFSELRGVITVQSGFCGGWIENPTYREVCDGNTGHAEVVNVVFDPDLINFADLLRIFFTIHNPTTLNQQGMDVGDQYRSAIFYHSAGQEKIAKEIVEEFEKARTWKDPIVTEIVPYITYYKAEDYHQGYFGNNPQQPYCSAVIAPKVAKFRQMYFDRLKK